jgi:hypothetical protein
MSDPLSRHSLPELEDAERRLRAHIDTRRRSQRPSKARRIIGLFFSVPMIVLGSAILFWGIKTEHYLGLHMWGGICAMLGGCAWVYCDWIE